VELLEREPYWDHEQVQDQGCCQELAFQGNRRGYIVWLLGPSSLGAQAQVEEYGESSGDEEFRFKSV
jgi:hypothetical protein